jgi:hypothetical protein
VSAWIKADKSLGSFSEAGSLLFRLGMVNDVNSPANDYTSKLLSVVLKSKSIDFITYNIDCTEYSVETIELDCTCQEIGHWIYVYADYDGATKKATIFVKLGPNNLISRTMEGINHYVTGKSLAFHAGGDSEYAGIKGQIGPIDVRFGPNVHTFDASVTHPSEQ